jgi:hypothetical protein
MHGGRPTILRVIINVKAEAPLLKSFHCFCCHQISLKESPLAMPLRHVEGAEVQLHSFSTSVLGGEEWLNSRPNRFTSGKNSQYPLNGKKSRIHSQSARFAG